MKKRVANRGVAWLCVLAGAAVVDGSGCSDLTDYVDKYEGGVRDGGKGGASGSSSSRKDGGVAGKSGSGGSSSGSSGGGIGGVGGSSQMGGQSSSSRSSDAGVDAPVGGTAGSSAAAGSGGAGVMSSSGGTTTPPSSGGSSTPASSGGSGGSNSRDAGIADRPTDPALCVTAATCQAPTAGTGWAVCQGGRCGISCNLGYHLCGNSCLADNSSDSCGSSCTPCSKPASNGSATCSGIPLACAIHCNLGFHACGSSCVVDGSTSTSSCGNTCAPCTAPANGTVTCNGHSCVQACNSGYHLCNGACIPNNSVNGCGTASCTPCRVPANGSPTCIGNTCGFECSSNYHKCGNNCASNNDPNNCGSGCVVCPGDLNGSAVCEAGSCKIACKTGYHQCDGKGPCVRDDSRSTDNCGKTCKPCQTIPDTAVSCDGVKCVYKNLPCTNNQIRCGTDTTCVDQNDEQCGPECANCTLLSVPTNAKSICQNGACVTVCDSGIPGLVNCASPGEINCVVPNTASYCGQTCARCTYTGGHGAAVCTPTTLKCDVQCDDNYHLCDGTCLSNDDPGSCGSSCEPCSTSVSHAETTCVDHKCGFKCAATFHLCKDDAATPCHPDEEGDCPAIGTGTETSTGTGTGH